MALLGRKTIRFSLVVALVFLTLLARWSEARPPAVKRSGPILASLSPAAEAASSLGGAWRLAEAYAATHAGCEVMCGCGDSMLPLYPDRTVLVVQTVATAELKKGMTVVFAGDHGSLVAHVLLEKTSRGWQAIGLANREPDRRPVGFDNLIGVVVRAYTPTVPATQAVAPEVSGLRGEPVAAIDHMPFAAEFGLVAAKD